MNKTNRTYPKLVAKIQVYMSKKTKTQIIFYEFENRDRMKIYLTIWQYYITSLALFWLSISYNMADSKGAFSLSKKRHIWNHRLKNRAVSFCPVYHVCPSLSTRADNISIQFWPRSGPTKCLKLFKPVFKIC